MATAARNAIIGLTVGLGCLAYVLKEVDLLRLWRQIIQVPALYVLGVNLLHAASFLARSLRWRVLLGPAARVPVSALLSANLIGYMANNLLPARMGEPVRAWAGSRLGGVPLAVSVSSLAAEKIVDGPIVLLFFFTTMWLLGPGAEAGSFSLPYLKAIGWSLVWLYLILAAGLVLFIKNPGFALILARRLPPRWSAKAVDVTERIAKEAQTGLARLRSLTGLLILFALSLAVRAPILAMHILFLPAVGLPPDLFMGAMATVGGTLASAVPGGPGYVGAYQLAVYWCLLMAGAPDEPAMAYAVIYWAVQYFPQVAAGLFETYRHGFRLASLGKPANARPPEGA